MPGRGRALRTSVGTLVLLLVIVLLAVGGGLLAGAAPVLGVAHGSQVALNIPGSIWGLLFLSPLLIGFAAYVVRWAVSSPASGPVRAGACVAVAVLVGLLLTGIAFQVNWGGTTSVGVGPTSQTGSGGAPGSNHTSTGNSTGNSTNSTNSTNGNGTSGNGGSGSGNRTGNNTTNSGGDPNGTGNNGTGGTGHPPTGGGAGGSGSLGSTGSSGSGGASSLQVANWAFLAIALGLCVLVGVLSIPGVLGRLLDRAPPRREVALAPPVGSLSEARVALREARVAIEAGENARETIVRLYGRLVGRLAPAGEDLSTSTAQEIERNRLAALKVPPARSQALTQMFEEACYSSHPIDRPAADRFVETMRAVEHDLYVGGAIG